MIKHNFDQLKFDQVIVSRDSLLKKKVKWKKKDDTNLEEKREKMMLAIVFTRVKKDNPSKARHITANVEVYDIYLWWTYSLQFKEDLMMLW